ncbi:MAG: type II toxin-antitoxin system VapC family toxin [Planctomycetes bacterium]|nr:type II toxin-antitoxin system VapC family toxin [Planctomycetota bacterium]
MIYLDTSWLVKRLVAEPDARAVRAAIDREDELVASEIAWVEFHSALARRVQEGSLSGRQRSALLQRFQDDWQEVTRVSLTEPVLSRAARLVVSQDLRTLDAIQLASAMLVAEHSPTPLRFGTADRRLLAAALAVGFEAPDLA